MQAALEKAKRPPPKKKKERKQYFLNKFLDYILKRYSVTLFYFSSSETPIICILDLLCLHQCFLLIFFFNYFHCAIFIFLTIYLSSLKFNSCFIALVICHVFTSKMNLTFSILSFLNSVILHLSGAFVVVVVVVVRSSKFLS